MTTEKQICLDDLYRRLFRRQILLTKMQKSYRDHWGNEARMPQVIVDKQIELVDKAKLQIEDRLTKLNQEMLDERNYLDRSDKQ